VALGEPRQCVTHSRRVALSEEAVAFSEAPGQRINGLESYPVALSEDSNSRVSNSSSY